MNLADAIRRAAQSSGATLGQPETAAVNDEAPKASPHPNPSPSQPQAVEEQFGGEVLAEEQKMKSLDRNSGEAPQFQSEPPAGHNVVRLELVLNPEQLKGFFGAVIASQHSVLTLREAAGFLRVSQTALDRMAEDGDVPGMMVDGKWRFTRPALEEWLCSQPKRKGA
jgi:excisionase family DNA binding protein